MCVKIGLIWRGSKGDWKSIGLFARDEGREDVIR